MPSIKIRDRAGVQPATAAVSSDSRTEQVLARLTLVAALPTPFRHADVGALDEGRFSDLVARLVEAGMRDLLVAGAAGEGSTLTHRERERLVRLAVEAGPHAAVVAATGTYGTAETIALTRAAKAAGASAALVTVPYYNKPTQDGIVAHVEAIAGACDLPLVVSNVAARTGIGLAPSTVARLAAIERVMAVELAPCGAEDRERIRHAVVDGRLPAILGGVDAEALVHRLGGGAGSVSATAAVAPEPCLALHRAFSDDLWSTARRIEARLRPLMLALGPDGDPARLKHALARRHGWSPEPRLPLVPVSREEADAIDAALEGLVDD